MNINNKKESLKFIKDNKLNHFGEVNFSMNDFKGVNEFINKYPVLYYFLRELKPSSKNVFYSLSKDEVLQKVSLYDNFGLDVSSLNYKDNIKMTGEIKYCRSGEFVFSGSTNSNSTHRHFLKPNYFIETNMFDRRVKYIPFIDKIINYIYKNDLFDYIIEFVIFDIPVGVYNDEVVIYEIRNNY